MTPESAPVSCAPPVERPALTRAIAPRRHARSGHVPGEAGVWLLILGDMTIFGVFFAVYSHARAADRDLFTQAQQELSFGIGLINTVLLLMSSWFVALAVKSVRRGSPVPGSRYFLFALLCGLGFLVNKVIEYSEKLSAGLTPMTNDFLMYFYVLTGIHATHVIIGMSILLYLWRRTRAAVRTPSMPVIEGGASYWHLVDVLWIVLFPLLYLV